LFASSCLQVVSYYYNTYTLTLFILVKSLDQELELILV